MPDVKKPGGRDLASYESVLLAGHAFLGNPNAQLW